MTPLVWHAPLVRAPPLYFSFAQFAPLTQNLGCSPGQGYNYKDALLLCVRATCVYTSYSKFICYTILLPTLNLAPPSHIFLYIQAAKFSF